MAVAQAYIDLGYGLTSVRYISALGHDIDRTIEPVLKMQSGEDYYDYKNRHAKRSADLVSLILIQEGLSKEIRDEIVSLITHHEVGGTEEQNMLQNADSVAFFVEGLPRYLESRGEEQTASKVHFMFDRVPDIVKNYIVRRVPIVKDLVMPDLKLT